MLGREKEGKKEILDQMVLEAHVQVQLIEYICALYRNRITFRCATMFSQTL
jgi:hypothetical protein